jgi:enoyl-CoA hydratase/carnithine racemase
VKEVTEVVGYELRGAVATVTMDDGKVNALSPGMLQELDEAFDRAEADGAVVVLGGRPGIFSAGFDLQALRAGGPEAVSMLTAGFELAERMLSFPRPVVVACPGHAIAMGSFLVLSADYRLGVSGDFRITANEVAIGLTMPRAAIEICRQRLAPAHFDRAVMLAEVFTPDAAVTAGFLDRVVGTDQLARTSAEVAQQLATLDPRAHLSTKMRVRSTLLRDLRAAIEKDDQDLTPTQ